MAAKMNTNLLKFISLVVSSLAILYLLFTNLNNNAFIIKDWVVVTFDLVVKTIIDIYVYWFSKE